MHLNIRLVRKTQADTRGEIIVNRSKKGISYSIIVIALLLILAACSSQEASTPTPEPAEVVSEVGEDHEEAGEEHEQDEDEQDAEVEIAVTNAVEVMDQTLAPDGTVTIAAVTADVDGWMVIHAQAEGNPGPIIGTAPVRAGVSNDVVVAIDAGSATETVYAMLHVDGGTIGDFEFPGGDDLPAKDADENVVTPQFLLSFPNSVTVENQELADGGTVSITEISSAGPGWMVIHAQAEGKPGPILGVAAVNAGISRDLIVEIDPAGATETVYAMLHVDAGTEGEFEFPGGDDVPAADAEGSIVTPPFMITGGSVAAPALLLSESQELGTHITDAAGMSLYTFAIDVPSTSNCNDRCAAAWPPMFIEQGAELTAGEGIPGELGTTERQDGTLMVTYNDWPLYYWVNDEAPGDTNGHNVNNVWAVAYPTTHVFLGGNDELGRFLVGPNGLTLYRFNPDEPGLSNCSEGCAAVWPPFVVEEGEIPRGNAGVVGQLGTSNRDDGTVQVTYQGMPLYHWVNDAAPGDATGHKVNDVWFVVPPYTVRLGSTEELGDFLVGAGGMTLYLFTVDEEGFSSCNDQCAANWPPLLVQAGEVPVAGSGINGDLGVTERDDETLQVTYNGTPLYFWINDEAPGDTTGHTVNDVWFVVAP